MILSMTGFGRARFEVAGRGFDVEIRSVNHRHLDARVRLPRPLAEFEGLARALVQERLGRGKVDVTIASVDANDSETEVRIDEGVARRYVDAARRLTREHGLAAGLDVAGLLSLPGVVRLLELGLPPEQIEAGVRTGMRAALEALVRMRAEEGERLGRELSERLERVSGLVDFFAARAGEVRDAARERLRKRTEQIQQETGLYDEARLHQEIVIAADRLDITEELVRLRSHVEQFRGILSGGSGEGPVGRRLDFLLQEFGREANTIGSKANDAPLAHHVVELKTEIERIREQVQNIE
jgi:uncharacterized protein (TIGR00255 family)